MQFNVALLLREAIGATRRETFAGGEVERGRARLTRIADGILVEVDARVRAEAECSRCLAQFGSVLPVSFAEVFHQRIDPRTGAKVQAEIDEPDPFFITEDHVIDITEALRQYKELAAALQPLCRPDCPGLCPQCGTDLASGACDCELETIDPRLAVLTAFSPSGRNPRDEGDLE